MNFKFRKSTIKVETHRVYGNGRMAVQLTEEGMPYCTLSVNIEEAELAEDCFWLKDWSENEEIAKHMLENALIILTGRTYRTGFVTAKEAKLVIAKGVIK